MSVITFVNNRKEETGKTLSLVAIATNMAIENNEKILIISTTNKESKIKSCFFEDTEVKKMRLGIFGQNMSALDTEAGIDGLAKMLRSNKLNPDMITNYTKVVFKDRLEVLLGKNKSERNQNIEEKVQSSPIEIADEYVEISCADQTITVNRSQSGYLIKDGENVSDIRQCQLSSEYVKIALATDVSTSDLIINNDTVFSNTFYPKEEIGKIRIQSEQFIVSTYREKIKI